MLIKFLLVFFLLMLVLRDVLRWSAKETAGALDTTVAAVNSALQRAHAQLAEKQLSEGTVEDTLTPEHEHMLERYVQAFWAKDVDALVTMLAADAVWEMPPFTGWYRGARTIADLIDHNRLYPDHKMVSVTPAEGTPAFEFSLINVATDPVRDQAVELLRAYLQTPKAASLFSQFGIRSTSVPVTMPTPQGSVGEVKVHAHLGRETGSALRPGPPPPPPPSGVVTTMMHSPLQGSGLVPGGHVTGGSVANAGPAQPSRATAIARADRARLSMVSP